jgi:hypothetical protein
MPSARTISALRCVASAGDDVVHDLGLRPAEPFIAEDFVQDCARVGFE